LPPAEEVLEFVGAGEVVPPAALVPALFVPVAAELSVGESVVDDPESAAEPLPDDESTLPPGDVPSGQILVELFGS
jgi:hypothetical protein